MAMLAPPFDHRKMADDVDGNEGMEVKKPSKARQKRQRDKVQSRNSTDYGNGDEFHVTSDSVDGDASLQMTEPQIHVVKNERTKDQEEGTRDGQSVPGQSATKRKKRRKKEAVEFAAYPYPAGTILGDMGHHLHEDIVEMDMETNLEGLTKGDRVWHTVVSNQAPGKLFVESNGFFKGLDTHKPFDLPKRDLKPATASDTKQRVPSAVFYGLSLREKTERLTTCCQGFLAGFALWQGIMVYCLGPPRFSLNDFAQHYGPFAGAVPAIFYLLLTICIVSLMGRCGICLGDESGSILCRPYAILLALLVYVATLVLSLSIADLDDQLSLYSRNASEELETSMRQWRNVNLCRCFGAILGWLILCSCPTFDRFVVHLEALLN